MILSGSVSSGSSVGGSGNLDSFDAFSSLQEAILLEERLRALADGVVDGIEAKIRTSSMGCVRQLSSCPSCFVVSFSDLVDWNFSPEFYSSESQATLVGKVLRGVRDYSVRGILAKVRQMTESASVSVNHVAYALNPKTLGVLQGVLDSVGGASVESS